MIIETERLTKKFGRHGAVNELSLAVPEGAALALIGSNGAGKTTTLRMLVNILRPDRGSARVLGVDTTRLSHRDFMKIGYVSENQKLPERLRVDQYFDYLRGFYPSWDAVLEKELRRRLDLPWDRHLGKLSHGMRMKTLLTSVLAFRPSLLILDEPLSGLDPLVRDEIIEGVLRQADETTIVISSHELSEIESCITHVAFMSKGRLLFQEPVEMLGARFRDVSVVLAEPAEPRAPAEATKAPDTWLALHSSSHQVRFVDTAFTDEQALQQKVAALFGRVERCEALPMSLRNISKSLMRAARAE
jgi:ABC-2 type transport system ATP-binding protein